MVVNVFPTLSSIPDEAINNKTVIVVDVLRATTTITAALAAGCLEVIPVLTQEEAIAMRERLEDERLLLGGERNSLKISGFNLGNSPLEYTPEVVAGKRIIITTTNGTRAISRAVNGSQLLLGAIINATAVARLAAGVGNDIAIICAGTRDYFALEDFLAAGLIIDQLKNYTSFASGDGAQVAWDYYNVNRYQLNKVLKAGFHGRQLIELGFEADIDYCAKVDQVDIVPVYKGGIIKACQDSCSAGS